MHQGGGSLVRVVEEVALPASDFPSAPVQAPAGCRGSGAASVQVAV